MISIIVPVYNIEDNISFCIDSILNQTYKDFEIIIIDDGSTDKSGIICDEYAKSNTCIKVIHQTNQGLSCARNTGLELSTGSLIMFVDGDDIINKHLVEILYSDFTNTPNTLYSSCWYQKIKKYELDDEVDNIDDNVTVIDTSQVAIDLLAGRYENISAWGKLYDKSKIGLLRFPAGKVHFEDKAFLFSLLINNPDMKISEHDIKLYGYFIRNNSITHSKYNTHVLDILYHSGQMLDIVKKRLPEYTYLGERNDAISHLMVLKSIIRSHVYKKELSTFRFTKYSLLNKYGRMPQSVLGKYWIEIQTLKISDFIYIIFVYLYDSLH